MRAAVVCSILAVWVCDGAFSDDSSSFTNLFERSEPEKETQLLSERDAQNLHEARVPVRSVMESVSHKVDTAMLSPSKIESIGCEVKAERFEKELRAKRPITVNCKSSCAMNVGETDPGWEVL